LVGAAIALLRLLPLLLLVVVGGAFWVHYGGEPRTLLRDGHATLRDLADSMPLITASFYTLIHATAVACAIPLASLLTPLAGALFGIAGGAVVALIAVTTGGSFFFIAVRAALGTRLRGVIAARIARMDRGFESNAFHYLVALRLLPLVPFWLVTAAAAASGMRLRVFVAGTAVGAAPGATIYASLGAGLRSTLNEGSVLDAGLLLRPEILVPLAAIALLALVPVLWRRQRIAK
jgi:uncharacterized membrane protein YdjX (TVP38/TMEM64 family)